MTYSAQELAHLILRIHSEAEVAARAKNPGRVRGTEYLESLLKFAYSEHLDELMRPWFDDKRSPEEIRKSMGSFPEKMLIQFLFDCFRQHIDEEAIREMFAQFGPKTPRSASVERERLILKAYLKEFPPKIQFARSIVDYNKTVPRQKRLGSRSTSEINTVKYLDRLFEKYRDEIKQHVAINRAWHSDIIPKKCRDKDS